MLLAFVLWLLTIVIFDESIFLKLNQQEWSSLELIFTFLDITIGIVAFGYFIISVEKTFHKKYPSLKASILSILAFFISSFGGILIVFLPFIFFSKTISITNPVTTSKNILISSDLKMGSSGEQVKILQSALGLDKNIYPSGIVSTYYGALTKEAVTNFQKINGLNQTGKVDGQTAEKFNEVYGKKTREFYLNRVTMIKSNNNDYTNTNSINVSGQNGENYKMQSDPNAPPGFFKMENVPPEKMATIEELNQAMNNYRKSHGLNELNINGELCIYANQRAHEIASVFTHDAFGNHIKNGDYRNSGYSWFNENIWQGYFSGTHIVEYAWDRSEGHKHTQLDNWSGGCAGVYDKYVSFLFAR